jgi:hypothetical protein
LPNGHRLEDLEARSTSDPKRNDIDGSAMHERSNIFHYAGDLNALMTGGQFKKRSRWIPPNDAKRCVRDLSANSRQYSFYEIDHGIFIRHPVHSAGKNQAGGLVTVERWAEILDVNACGNHRDSRGIDHFRKDIPVMVRHSEYVVCPFETISFETFHGTVLSPRDQLPEWVPCNFVVMPPNCGFHVVREYNLWNW